MQGGKILTAEFGISMAIVMWAAIRKNYWPWPPSLIRTAIAYAILGMVAVANEDFAALLGTGFLLAQIVKTPVDAQGNFMFTGSQPGAEKGTDFVWDYLRWGANPDNDPRKGQQQPSKSATGGTGSYKGLQPIGDTPPGTVVPPGKRDGSIPIWT